MLIHKLAYRNIWIFLSIIGKAGDMLWGIYLKVFEKLIKEFF